MEESFKLLKEYKYKLTKQQYRTLKGQVLKGDIEGFRKGLFKIAKLNYVRKWLNGRSRVLFRRLEKQV